MKIAIDARFYGTEHSGLGRYTINFLQALQKIDKENTYYVLMREPYAKSVKFNANFHVVVVNIPHYSVKEQLVLPSLIKKLDVEFFHALHLNVPVFMNTPLIVTIHDLIKSHFKSKDTTTKPGPIFALKRIGYNLAINKAIKKSKSIIVPSKFVKQDIINNFPSINKNKIYPVYEAPDPIFQKPIPITKTKKTLKKYNLENTDYLLYVGNAWPHKNLKTLLKAFEELRIKSLKLVLVSKKNHFLNKLLSNTPGQVRKNLIQIEGIVDEDLYALYKHAKATVTPSFMEGFGLVGIESLSVGTPVIASNIPVYKEVYGDSVIYADPNNSKSFTKAIHTVLKKKPKIARSFTRSYNWEKLAKEIRKIYYETSSNL